VLGGLLVAAACIAMPAGAATAVASANEVACAVTYKAQTTDGGFSAKLMVTNTGTTAIRGWTLVFPVDEGVKVVTVTNAVIVNPENPVTLQNAPHNGTVLPQRFIGVGIGAVGPVQNPAWFEVNGIRCATVR
jgi:glucuronoarabinoxylan endo-1,4-beta-xylanase